jgi:hypothetical protein
MLCPCHAANGLKCVFPIWFTQCGRVWFTLAMPRPCYALTMPFFSRPQHSCRDGLRATCLRSASSGYHVEFHEDCYQKHTDPPHNDPYLQLERVVAAHYKKDDLLNCWTFLATTRTFTMDTALSEHGRGSAWHMWINGMARHGNGMCTAWTWHVTCESAFNVFSLILYACQDWMKTNLLQNIVSFHTNICNVN